MRVASALQIKLLNSQCHLSAFLLFFFLSCRNKARRRNSGFGETKKENKGRTEKRGEIKAISTLRKINGKTLCTCGKLLFLVFFWLKGFMKLQHNRNNSYKYSGEPILLSPLYINKDKSVHHSHHLVKS